MSSETNRNFFHCFVNFGRVVLYPKFVQYPKSAVEASNHTREFDMAGMHGAIGSMDACHVTIGKCSHRLKQNHLGGKSKQTARCYNLTCNHRRRILHTTCGHPARWNDKTIVLYDELARGLKNGKIMEDNVFELLQKDDNGLITKMKYRGAWLLVDNGYLNWGIIIPPMKQTIYVSETRWSQWLESMRKDVECTFGILKGRWRILKAGVRCNGVEMADNIWMTCCALHNISLDIDGNDVNWQGEIGNFDFDEDSENIPFALQRLSNPGARRTYDSSGIGPGRANEEKDEIQDLPMVERSLEGVVDTEVVNEVRLLSADIFQKKLIEHFDILFQQNKVQWPRKSKC